MFRNLILAILLLPLPAFGWGKEGHEIVAHIAYLHLNAGTRIKVNQLLGASPGTVGPESMEQASVWADEIRGATQMPVHIFSNLNIHNASGTAELHFADVSGDRFNPQTDADHGKSVVSGIQRCEEVLRNPQSSPADKQDALKFLIHFVGDAHQPLHAGHKADRGGNDIEITQFLRRHPSKGFNLHAVWDNLLIQADDRDPARYAEKIDAKWVRTYRDVSWDDLDPIHWVDESHQLAVKYAYLDTHGKRIPNRGVIGAEYVERSTPVVESQLMKAGYRLATLLNALVK